MSAHLEKINSDPALGQYPMHAQKSEWLGDVATDPVMAIPTVAVAAAGVAGAGAHGAQAAGGIESESDTAKPGEGSELPDELKDQLDE